MKTLAMIPLLLCAAAPAAPAFAETLADGVAAFESHDYSAALSALGPLAEQGNAEAQLRLGLMYRNGWGVAANFTRARRWYRAAADQDNARAQYELGKLASDCQGFAADNPELVRLLHRSADLGFRDAQELLGYMYAYGIGGVPTDYVKAYLWYDLAAAQGGKNDAEKRDLIAKNMSLEQIAEAQKLAGDRRPK